MPLSMVNAGEPFTIKRIGGKEEVKRHLEELGFVVGGVVTVVSEINGSLMLENPGLPLEKIWQARLWSEP